MPAATSSSRSINETAAWGRARTISHATVPEHRSSAAYGSTSITRPGASPPSDRVDAAPRSTSTSVPDCTSHVRSIAPPPGLPYPTSYPISAASVHAIVPLRAMPIGRAIASSYMRQHMHAIGRLRGRRHPYQSTRERAAFFSACIRLFLSRRSREAAVGFVFLRGRGLRARRSSSRRSFSRQVARLRYWLRLSRALTVMPVGV